MLGFILEFVAIVLVLFFLVPLLAVSVLLHNTTRSRQEKDLWHEANLKSH